MEKHTPKSSANSSLPASQSPNDDTARTRPGAKGKGPSYNDARCANTRTRESIRVLSVDACQRCGEDLTDAACIMTSCSRRARRARTVRVARREHQVEALTVRVGKVQEAGAHRCTDVLDSPWSLAVSASR